MRNALTLGIVPLLWHPLAAQQSVANSYTQTNLDSSVPGMGFLMPSLINPWGLAAEGGPRAGSAWFIADNGNGLATIIEGDGDGGTTITIPPATGTGNGSPAGECVFTGAHLQTFATLDGTISSYYTGTRATIVVNNSATGAVYTECTTFGSPPTFETMYVANSAGGVEAYDPNFNRITLPPGAFVDPNIPAGFTPYGISATGKQIWVSFFNGTAGEGQGYIDAFDQNGAVLLRLQQGQWMNQPSGMVKAPTGFGKFSQALLVAMTGSGVIAAFNPETGAFGGVLEDSSGQPIVNLGIHGIAFGKGNVFSGPTTTLFFTAGISGFTQGLFGSITAN